MKTIVVDDDQRNRQRIREMLESAGHRTAGFESADLAAQALADADFAVDLVVTDVQMPGELDGVEFAALLAEVRPDLAVIVMSAGVDQLHRVRERGLSCPTLLKPLTADELLAAVGEALVKAARFADPGPALRSMYREAAKAGHPHVGTEHLTLAAMAGPSGLATFAEVCDLSPDNVRAALASCCPHRSRPGELGTTVRTTRLVAYAAHIAYTEGASTVDSSHLVRALVTSPRAVAWRGLAAAGLGHPLVRRSYRSWAAATCPEPPRVPHS